MSNNNIIDDTEIQTAYNQNKDELLHSISFNGLETNPVMSSSLQESLLMIYYLFLQNYLLFQNMMNRI